MSRKPDFIFSLPVKPRLLIEANAGTGKTYTIVGLYVRLIVQKEIPVDKILVVTFTNKATAELRDRILKRLRECVGILQSDSAAGANDSFLEEFLKQVTNRDEAISRLRNAIQNFDESNVFTIHGFCQKILKEEALLSRTPFEIKLTPNDDLLSRAAEDYWRVFMEKHSDADAGRYLICKMLNIAKSPAELKKKLQLLFKKPYARIEGDMMDNPAQYLSEVLALKAQMKQIWEHESEELEDIFQSTGIRRYQQYLESRKRKFESFFSDTIFSTDAPDVLEYFTSEYVYDPGKLKNSGTPTRKHRFFDLCSDYAVLINDIHRVETAIIYQSYLDIAERRKVLAEKSGEVTYDDLLLMMERAITEGAGSGMLRNKLLEKYPYALVDEFQDTDPVQYNIFDRVYPESGSGHSLMMIGDPKQAIYGFRGADVYTYLKARSRTDDNIFTLNENFRSSPGLIKAVNALFGSDEDSFIENRIEFQPSESGKPGIEQEYLAEGRPPAPLRITFIEGVETSKSRALDQVYTQTVNEIAGLLDKAEEGKVLINGKILQAGDIAVLVSSHKDAAELKYRLKKTGVDAVTYSRQKVFQTFEAKRMELLMKAVLNPVHRKSVNNALFSGLFGLDLHRLFELKEEEYHRQQLTGFLDELHEIWSAKGFYAMFRKLMVTGDKILELANLENAERVFTNLFQLADICSKAEQEGKLDPNALYSWYLKELASDQEDEEKTLLLESDQNLVKISTIHNSKGLEFPVVFCPTLWLGYEIKKEKPAEYHEDESWNTVINISKSDSKERNRALARFTEELVAEEVRKTYVALTRAKYECRVIWKTHTNSNLSGLGAALLGGEKFREYREQKVTEDSELSDHLFSEKLGRLAGKSPLTIEMIPQDGIRVRTEKVKWRNKTEASDSHQLYSGRTDLPVRHAMESFSSLVHHKPPDEPDYEQFLEEYTEALHAKSEQATEHSIFTFPRGATAGTAIHKLFEDPDFDFSTASASDHSDIISSVLEEYEFDEKWNPAIGEMMRNVSSGEIGPLKMAEVKPVDQLREMEFHFSAPRVSAADLFTVIRNGKQPALPSHSVKSYMTGFIDLIVRQNGKYYIIDYKSNHLGDSADDYSHKNMQKEILSAGYDLQYHIYTVALVKYLKSKIDGFNYEHDFGGAGYLFVRGIRQGSDTGIWFHKPDQKVIENLEFLLSR